MHAFIEAYSYASAGTYTATVSLTELPDGDVCSDAIEITSVPHSWTDDNPLFIHSCPVCTGTAGPDVWHEITVPAGQVLRVEKTAGIADTYFVVHDSAGTGLGHQMVFIYFNSGGHITAADSVADFATYAANTWYHIELSNIDWTAHTFDIAVDGTPAASGVPFRDPVSDLGRIDLYNFSSSSTGWWDEIQFN